MSKGEGGPPTHHAVPHGTDWAMRRGGWDRASGIFGTTREAVERGREILRNAGTELRIHTRDGRTAGGDGHGGDSNPPKG